MSNTDFEDAPGGENSEELVLDAERPGEEADHEDSSQDTGNAEDAHLEGGQQEEVRRGGRANEAIRELRARAQEERAHRERIEREFMEFRAAQQARQQQPSPEQEAERLALMSPEERADYKLNKALNEIQRQNAMSQFQTADRSDKALYDAKATTDKVYAKYAEKVETERQRQMRENNMVIPREELLKWIVGQDVLQNRGKKVAAAARRGQDNIRRQTASVVNGRGNTPANRQSSNANTQQARYERIKDLQI